MRILALRTLAFGAAILLTLPLLAQAPQRGGRGGGGFGAGMQDPAMILMQKSVQDELKLSDEQKAELQKAQEKMRSAMREAFQSAGGDREKLQEAMKPAREEAKKEIDKVRTAFKPEQTKRLRQLEIQFAGLRAFTEADVQKELKLTDKQKTEIKDIADGAVKDARELFTGAQGDRERFREVGRKVEALQKEAMEKVSGLLTEDQKKTWTEMVGEKFDKFERFGGRGPGSGPPNQQRQKAGKVD